MVTNSDKLKSLVELSKQLKEVDWFDEVYKSGILHLDANNIDLLVAIDDMDLDLVVEKGGAQVSTTKLAKLVVGDSVHVSFRCPHAPQAFFAKSFDEFLPNHKFRYQQPALFYLDDRQLLVEQGVEADDPLVSAYQAVLELIGLIEAYDISDHHSLDHDRYFLFLGHEKKFRLSITYAAQNLRNGGENIKQSVERLKGFIEDGVHPGDKRLILKKTFIEMLAPQGEMAGFAFLIENLSELVDRFIGNFELYAGKYTFDDEKQKLLIEVRDYFRSINDAISSAQVRLVAIPLTLLIVISKMEVAKVEVNALLNVAVLLGVFIFAILMGRLTYSQKETLEAEVVEIDSRKKQIEEKYATLYKSLSSEFERLEKRLSIQGSTLRIIDGSIILICLLSILIFFYYDSHTALTKILSSPLEFLYKAMGL